MEQIDDMMQTLQNCMDTNADMRQCLHTLVPTFREPNEVNNTAVLQEKEGKVASA